MKKDLQTSKNGKIKFFYCFSSFSARAQAKLAENFLK